jgi:hypothetical protein
MEQEMADENSRPTDHSKREEAIADKLVCIRLAHRVRNRLCIECGTGENVINALCVVCRQIPRYKSILEME